MTRGRSNLRRNLLSLVVEIVSSIQSRVAANFTAYIFSLFFRATFNTYSMSVKATQFAKHFSSEKPRRENLLQNVFIENDSRYCYRISSCARLILHGDIFSAPFPYPSLDIVLGRAISFLFADTQLSDIYARIIGHYFAARSQVNTIPAGARVHTITLTCENRNVHLAPFPPM